MTTEAIGDEVDIDVEDSDVEVPVAGDSDFGGIDVGVLLVMVNMEDMPEVEVVPPGDWIIMLPIQTWILWILLASLSRGRNPVRAIRHLHYSRLWWYHRWSSGLNCY